MHCIRCRIREDTGTGDIYVQMDQEATPLTLGMSVMLSAAVAAAPIPIVVVAAGQKTPTNTEPLRFVVAWSEPVSGFTAEDASPSLGAVTGCREVLPNDGTTFEIQVAAVPNDGLVCLSIPAGAAIGLNGSTSLPSAESGGCIVVDRTPPPAPELIGPADSLATSAAAPKFSWTASADASGIKNYRIVIAGPTNRDTYTTRTNYAPSLSEGVYTWRLNCRDQGGNTSAWTETRTLIVDRSPPAAVALASPSRLTGSWMHDGVITITATGGLDLIAGTVGYEVAWTRNPAWSPTGTANRDPGWNGETFEPAEDGEWWCHAAAVDRAGNRSAAAHLGPFCIDREPPTLSGVTDTLRIPNDPGRLTATFDWSCVTVVDALDPNPSVQFSVPSATVFLLGRSEVTITVEDRAGNLLTRHVAVVVYNTEPPMVRILTPADSESIALGGVITPIWETSSLAALDSVWTDGLWNGCLDTRAPRLHQFSVTALDVSGLSATASVRYQVLYAKRKVEVLRVRGDGAEESVFLSTPDSTTQTDSLLLQLSDCLRIRCQVDPTPPGVGRAPVTFTVARTVRASSPAVIEALGTLIDSGETYEIEVPLAAFRVGQYTIWLGFADGTSAAFSFRLVR